MESKAHTCTPKDKKPQAHIFRGPHFSTDEVRDELNEKAPKAKLIKVEHYKTPFSKKMVCNITFSLLWLISVRKSKMY